MGANAYVGVVEWWLKNGMPYPTKEMAKKSGGFIREDYIDLSLNKISLIY
jgi:hypothetical protein